MSGRDIDRQMLLDLLKSDLDNGTRNSDAMLEKAFPELSAEQIGEVREMVASAMQTEDSDKVSLVLTAPTELSIKARSTRSVVRSMINSAERNILITGYSLSSYFADMTDTIIEKSQRGVLVKFFVNNIEKQSEFDKIIKYKGKYMEIYDYTQPEDTMSAFHAKVISVDQKKTLITSANLSYHGQQGNIEIGTLIDSKHVAKQMEDVFTKLVFGKVFREI